MDKKFHSIKIFLISLMILYSSLIVICPITSSLPLDTIYECEPIFLIDYNQTLLEEPIIPLAEARVIPIQIKGKIIGPAADIVDEIIRLKGGVNIYVNPYVEGIPEGCHASINPPLLMILMSTEFVSENATISIVVDQKLPALTQEQLTIRLISKALVGKATVVKPGNFTQKVPFTIGYYPQLDISTPDGIVKDIHPSETVSFPIELENLGNGITEVTSEVIDIPKGWSATIISTTFGTVVLGDDPNETLYLEINSPINFGYHEDRAVIKVSITPSYYKNSKYKGEPVYLSFIVQSRGFSAPGFEMIALLFAFIFILFPIWKRKNTKIEKKQPRGGK